MVDLAIIIAVGSAYHRSVLTYNRPAAMLPVLGKPMVARMMEQLHEGGIKRYVVVVGRDEGGVAAYLSKSWLPDVQVDFVLKPGELDLGRVLAKLTRQYQPPFIIASYNSFAHHNLTSQMLNTYDHQATDGLMLGTATFSLSQYEQPYSGYLDGDYVEAVVVDHTEAEATVRLLDFAICGAAFGTFMETLATSGQRPRHLMDIFDYYIQMQGPVRSVETDWILPVRCDADLLMLNQQMLERDQHTYILSEIPASVQIIPPVRIDPQVSVGPDAIVGPFVYLEAGSQIGAGAHVQHAVVLQNAGLLANETVSNLLIASRTRIQT